LSSVGLAATLLVLQVGGGRQPLRKVAVAQQLDEVL